MGRAEEVAALAALLDAAAAGRGGTAVIEGEAGIGKTRLLTAALALAGERGMAVALGRADEHNVDRPLTGLAEALGLEPASPDPERSAIGQLLQGDEPAAGGPDLGYRIVEQVVGLVEGLAGSGPLLLAVEDLHWADPLTLRVLLALGRAAGPLPLALLLSCRPYPARADVDRVLAELAGTGGLQFHLRLHGLEASDARRLGAEVAGAPLGPGLAGAVAAAAGNPLFVLELVRGLRDEGALTEVDGQADAGAGSLPATVHAAIRRRVALLPDATLRVLKVASVLGARFDVTELAVVLDTEAAQLLDDLDAALKAGVLEVADDALAFRHELIRRAVYEDLPVPFRKALHHQAAQALVAAGAPVGRVADQLFAGASAGDAKAVEWLARAGHQASPRSPVSAVALLERALALAEPGSEQADALACELAPLLLQTGRGADAWRLSREVLRRGPLPTVEAGLRRAVGEVLLARGQLEAALTELEAAASVPGGPDADRLGARAVAADIRLYVGRPEEGMARARLILEEARPAGDEFATSLALQTLAVGSAATGDITTGLELGTEAVAVAVRSRQARAGQLHPHLYLGLFLMDAGRREDAEVTLQNGRLRAEERGAVVWVPLYHWALALGRVLSGDWDDAEAEVGAGLAVADEVGTRWHVPFLHGIGAWIAVQRGELDRAQACFEAAVREFMASTDEGWQATATDRGFPGAAPRWPIEWGLWVGGLLHEAQGDATTALAEMEGAWAMSAPLRGLMAYRFLGPDLVRLARAGGDPDRAAAVAAEVADVARRSGTASAEGSALRSAGLAADDSAVLVAAVERLRDQGSPAELAAALEEAGDSLARAGRKEEATAALDEARQLFERFGAARPVARIDASLRALGVRRRRSSPPRTATSGWESLTRTELAVAGLAAEGLTNRQVGERLFVSRRTVETHLAHVFAKLGLGSRAQLAAEVARHAGAEG